MNEQLEAIREQLLSVTASVGCLASMVGFAKEKIAEGDSAAAAEAVESMQADARAAREALRVLILKCRGAAAGVPA